MPRIAPHPLPPEALLQRYVAQGAYTDCYATELPMAVPPANYVEAFYTTSLFKLERVLLAWLARRPSHDAEARDLAAGSAQRFAAWRVEARDAGQLLMADDSGRTRSWLMCAPIDGAPTRTRLYFGSAVLPRTDPATGERRMGAAFAALLGFHKLYSRLLLRSASARLSRQQVTGGISP